MLLLNNKGDLNMRERISDKMIAVDTEYHTNEIGMIDNVYCVCTTDNKGNHFKKWTSKTKDENILHEIAEFHGLDPKEMILVCHALDKAERRAFKFLGVENRNYKFICTWHLASMLKNSFSKKTARMKSKNTTYESDAEAIEAATESKLQKAKSLSYAGLCKDILKVNIDTAHKEEMRKLCIMNRTADNEQQIMDYCADDTKYLLPLLENLSKVYFSCLKNSFCPLRPGMFNEITFTDCFKYLITQCESINLFGEIADKGLPVDVERCNTVKRNAIKYRERMKAEFNDKYSGSYVLQKGLYKEDTKVTQKYMNDLLESSKLTSTYPKSDKTGKWSMSSDNLKEYFHDTNTFAEHYRQLNKLTRLLNGVSKQSDSPFDYIVDDKLWYESLQPYGTITSRCTPSTRKFVFGWHKSLYGILNPKPGKWLVELDYGSEETFVQCCICNDNNYHEIYQSKDIYLAFANKMGLVPNNDWNTLSKSELKEKYATVRKLIKPMILGLSYGMAAPRLAKRLNIPVVKAEGYVEKVNQILHVSTKYKSLLDEKAKRCKAFSLPDGFICRTAERFIDNNHTTVGNWPFQSAGGTILRSLIKTLDKANLKANVLATIHDAIFFEVDEGDYETINKVSEIMKETANKVLLAPADAGWNMKVGSPEIIKNGDIWCTDDETFVNQFKNLLAYSE